MREVYPADAEKDPVLGWFLNRFAKSTNWKSCQPHDSFLGLRFQVRLKVIAILAFSLLQLAEVSPEHRRP